MGIRPVRTDPLDPVIMRTRLAIAAGCVRSSSAITSSITRALVLEDLGERQKGDLPPESAAAS